MSSGLLIEEVSKLVSDITGIQLGKKQAAMVESRLTRRMLQLGFSQPKDYLAYIYDNRDTEVTALVSLLTTHHTNFFREFSHFEYLEKVGLPELIKAMRGRREGTLRIWSAACSRGHEVYSLAMFLDYHLKTLAPEMKFEIFGSDVDPKSVEIAANGVYKWDDIKSAPSIFLANHWMRGTGDIADFVKVKQTLKQFCSFGVVNLLEIEKTVKARMFDIVFCRNVFIYFALDQVRSVTADLMKHLHQDGYFFIGISETLNGTNLPVSYLAPSVYSHKRVAPAAAVAHNRIQPAVVQPVLPRRPVGAEVQPRPLVDLSKPFKVFCVDDSPTILGLLKKLLSKEHGFEVVGTAENGEDAAQKIKGLSVDVVTLDIHMPVQNGVEYLKKNMGPKHPPVVMVSSVSREDIELGLKSLELGAVDYVEKPSLADLAKRADEIRMKLRCAAISGKGVMRGVSEVEKAFQKSHVITEPEKKLRVILAGIGDKEKLAKLVSEIRGAQPPTVILFQGAGNMVAGILPSIKAATKFSVEVMNSSFCDLKSSTIYLGDYQHFEQCRAKHAQRMVSFLVFANMTSVPVAQLTSTHSKWHLIVEDVSAILSEQHRTMIEAANRVVPSTSFLYHSDEFFAEDGKGGRVK